MSTAQKAETTRYVFQQPQTEQKRKASFLNLNVESFSAAGTKVSAFFNNISQKVKDGVEKQKK